MKELRDLHRKYGCVLKKNSKPDTAKTDLRTIHDEELTKLTTVSTQKPAAHDISSESSGSKFGRDLDNSALRPGDLIEYHAHPHALDDKVGYCISKIKTIQGCNDDILIVTEKNDTLDCNNFVRKVNILESGETVSVGRWSRLDEISVYRGRCAPTMMESQTFSEKCIPTALATNVQRGALDHGEFSASEKDTSPSSTPEEVVLDVSEVPLGFDHPFGCSHIPKSHSISSKRVQAAYVCHEYEAHGAARNTLKNRRKRDNKKRRKQNATLSTCPPVPSTVHAWSQAEINNYHLVFDGCSTYGSSTLHRSTAKGKKELKSLSIQNGDLFIPSVTDSQSGLIHRPENAKMKNPNSCPSPYLLLPRLEVIKRTGMIHDNNVEKLWKALLAVEECHRTSTARGVPIYGEAKYIGCVGSQPKRAGRGVRESQHITKLQDEDWNLIVDYLLKLEYLFTSYVDTEIIRLLRESLRLIHYPTISRKGHTLRPNCNIFGAFAFGRNVYLPAHIDQDFTYSIVTVHLRKERYTPDDKVVVYFCFPRLGVAIPMKPGDVLIFNPQEPHAISSRCCEDDDIICMSAYLKSAVVGMNDNATSLLLKQQILADQWRKKL